MKNFLSVLLALIFVMALVACSNEKDTTSESDISTTTQTENTDNTETIDSDTTDEISSDTETPNNKPSISSENNTTSSNPSSITNTTSTNKPTHTHSFSNATCTEPKKCTCGFTDGVASGHKYSGYKCNVCNGLNPNEKYIKQTAIGIDGEGYFGRAGEDHGFVIKDECKNYVQSIDNIIATINSKKCTVYLALNAAEVEKLASDYVISQKEYYNNRGWNFDADDEETYKEIAQEHYLPCSAIAGINYPVGIFNEQKENIVDDVILPCDFIITIQYTLVDGTKIQQNWNYDAIYSYYSLGTIPAKCFSHTR